MATDFIERSAVQLRAIHQWAEQWSRHDIDAVLQHFVTDLTYEDVPTAQVSHSAADLKAFASAIFIQVPDVKYDIIRAFVHDDQGTAEWVMRGTQTGPLPGHPPTGKAFEVRGCSFFEFEGDKISRCSDYWDFGTLLRQWGLVS